MDFIDIKGLDLKIDKNIHIICEASNATSSSTRSVLYIFVVVCVLSFMTVINTNKWNWTSKRIEEHRNQISLLENKIGRTYLNSERMALQDSLEVEREIVRSKIRNKIESYETVRIPLLGDTFDVNDLGFISGLTFIILFVILAFTLSREINNLKIALNGISERYPDFADRALFEESLGAHGEVSKEDVLKSINHTRRQHHYNFLSMNEIFTLPPLKTNTKWRTTKTEKIVSKLFWLPVFVYLIILINDLLTIQAGYAVAESHTIFDIIISVLFSFIIFILAQKCSMQKNELYRLYKSFSKNHYTYVMKGDNA